MCHSIVIFPLWKINNRLTNFVDVASWMRWTTWTFVSSLFFLLHLHDSWILFLSMMCTINDLCLHWYHTIWNSFANVKVLMIQDKYFSIMLFPCSRAYLCLSCKFILIGKFFSHFSHKLLTGWWGMLHMVSEPEWQHSSLFGFNM